MKGGPWKTRKRKCKKSPAKKVASKTASSPGSEESNTVPGSDFAIVSEFPACSLLSTPKRGRRRTRQTKDVCLTSTPVRSSSTDKLTKISKSPPGAKQAELEYTEVITQLKAVEVDLPCCKSKSQTKCKKVDASQPRQLRKRVQKEQVQTCSETKGPQAKRQRVKTQRTEKGKLQKNTTSLSSKRLRPRFELKKPDSSEQDESLLSSDLSIELSHHEEQLPSLSSSEDEESEEEELPSFLMQMDKKPPSITEGAFVWHKARNYPFWPALVKRVNSKQKKASIVFIDDPMIHTKKGFSVTLKILKPFDCEEASELLCKAKENYDAVIEWSTALITDYRIRIACGSFSGSFIKYFAHDMSYPVRRKYPQTDSEKLTITSESMMEEPCDDLKEVSFSDEQEKVSRSSKRLLPDRTHAAHNRANEKLVHFIVKQHMVEGHLLAVIRGRQQSRWLRSFLSANRRRVVNTYLEDDQQLDQVYCYLKELYETEMATAPCLAEVKAMEHVPFVLDVLLPEAIIHAIAGVDNVSVKQAEEKYLKGRCISNRERQEFDLMIEQHIRKKHQNTALALLSDSIKLED
ncbi:PWWP domain-containing DNA repair factor 3A isoform X2 [Hippoglossus hippoglossus]|uniref:PWWP domain-containing DNA repair factor 3A n=1 Tax=Hippoglossus stenolepis TaxID=195615 RepID=UPI00148C53FA|nr:PWWP domain-containing DNA repair factor 3A isoform X2 [Hippoglossus hippoglossus]XP_034437159.1 PWWP domain-containing DNA repair factor 3A isoform X2 [Hippoglossus hippoglossus]XP_035029500.1 PWWP domain-containing DNA repair factor 3A [Hippoglossus stenolepis]XP_035029554.1 PWWP domain-containing DNA repair factor 3A [Hippoglossus stenolepis]XP_035029637.1 PWWP domain-containing DNA repair factor 3A [Hippoglossus stenolepis]XP_035029724.1 PWWP domain-containing DNA repair factor 3A [Hipp